MNLDTQQQGRCGHTSRCIYTGRLIPRACPAPLSSFLCSEVLLWIFTTLCIGWFCVGVLLVMVWIWCMGSGSRIGWDLNGFGWHTPQACAHTDWIWMDYSTAEFVNKSRLCISMLWIESHVSEACESITALYLDSLDVIVWDPHMSAPA